jgi:VanZ family protein
MGNRRLTLVVTLAYLSMILYASLSPFTGWRMPAENVLAFLVEPWPRYVTSGDIALNVTAYLPFGFLLCAALRPKLAPASAAIAATVLSTLLSLSMESMQMLLLTRIASKVDLLANASGAALGALIAWWGAQPRNRDNALGTLRRSTIRGGALGDAGLLVVALWIAIQFHPAPLLFSSGDLRDFVHVTPYFSHSAQSYWVAETTIVAIATVAIGLLISVVLQPTRYTFAPVLLVVVIALGTRAAAALAFGRAASWLQWLTPGAQTGLAFGIVVLALLLRLSARNRALIALFFIVGCVLLVNGTPGNPYHAPLGVLSAPPQTHLLSLNALLHGVSLVWPSLAAVYLLAVFHAEDGSARAAGKGGPL